MSSWRSVVLFWVPRHSWVRINEIADELAVEETVDQFAGPELAVGSISRIQGNS